MAGGQSIETRQQALMSLIMCAWYLDNRDHLIRRAHDFGITYAEIARILHMNRGHVNEIGNTKTRRPAPASPRLRAAQQPKDDR